MKSYCWIKCANLVEQNSILALSYRTPRSWSLCFTSLKCCFLLETVREKYSYISDPVLHFMPVAKNFSTICSWPQTIRNLQKEFAVTFVIELNRDCMKLAKFGILVNKTTYLFPSIRGSNISRGCGKNLEIPQGMGVNLRVWFRKI